MRGEYGSELCFLLFCSTFRLCRGDEGLDPEFRSLFGKVSSYCQTQNIITATLSSLIMLQRQSVKKFQNEEREERENVCVCVPKDLAKKRERPSTRIY